MIYDLRNTISMLENETTLMFQFTKLLHTHHATRHNTPIHNILSTIPNCAASCTVPNCATNYFMQFFLSSI
jgi:hypothetical protein